MVNFKLIIFISVLGLNQSADNTQILLGQLFKIITYVLTNGAGDTSDTSDTRQHQNYYRPPNNNGGISSTMYKALQTIAQNDELECVSRLLCETAAGGKPGSSRQINIDKQSLTALLSYLQLDAGGNSSPMLKFGKAALLGLSNRGDPYECNVNYPKCPRDQERLLYYLNNHRGGFFRFFDMQLTNNQNNNNYQNNYQYQGDYQNGLHYNIYLNKLRPNQQYLISPNKNHLYNRYRKQVKPEIYAKKYDHSSMTFSSKDFEKYSRGNKKTIVFPKDRKDVAVQERIQTKIVRVPVESDYFTFSSSNRGSKNLKQSNDYKISNFFPSGSGRPAVSPTDRLPNMLYIIPERGHGNPMKFPMSQPSDMQDSLKMLDPGFKKV